MNFKTTVILLVLVAAIGVTMFLTRDHGTKPATSTDAANGPEHKLLSLDSANVTRLAITAYDGKRTVLEKSGPDWRLVEPVKAPAKTFEVDDLVRAVTGLQTRGSVDESQKAPGGLDKPNFVVELADKDGKTTKISVGDKPQFGDTLLVQVGDNKKPDAVNTSIYATLDKPASTYRKAELVNLPAGEQIKQLAITRAGTTIKLQKQGNDWQITEPAAMPAEGSEVSNLVFGLTGLSASEFVNEDPAKAPNYGLAKPKVSIWYSAQAPATQPSAAAMQPAGETLKIGDYDDVLKRNVFAEVGAGPIVKIPATSETTFAKTVLDLRNREVATVDPEKVQSFTIAIDRPAATQPTSRPAETRQFTIERQKIAPATLGPALPENLATTQPATTQPATKKPPSTQPAATQVAATQPASTQPATQASSQPATSPAVAATLPATQPSSPWTFASGGQGDAEEGQVKALLDSFHPLRVEKYLEKSPTTQPSGSFVITLRANPPGPEGDTVIRFADPGATGRLIGSYKDLTFEVDRTLLDKLTGDFKTKKLEAPAPNFGGAGNPFGGAGGSPFGGR